MHGHQLRTVLIAPVEGLAFAAFDDQWAALGVVLGADQRRLGVVDHHVAWLHCSDLGVQILHWMAPIHVCEVGELKDFVSMH